jgi:hypothetical protein
MQPLFNFSTRRVGGIRFVRLGRFCLSFCIATANIAPAQATLAHARKAVDDNAYARCVARLIESKGLRFAVDHAGDTVCERDARRRMR